MLNKHLGVDRSNALCENCPMNVDTRQLFETHAHGVQGHYGGQYVGKSDDVIKVQYSESAC